MKNERKIKQICNGYIVTDSNNCEFYYSTLENVTKILKCDLEETVDSFGEFKLEYSIERINSDKSTEEGSQEEKYKNALLMIAATECILEGDTIGLMREVAQDVLNDRRIL
jgi:hypothetical protein